MRVLVCGGRGFKDYDLLKRALDTLLWAKPAPDLTIIHGGAPGADTLAGKWADNIGAKTEVYPADWGHLGGSAGPIRNKQMLTEGKPDRIIAFPGGRGTENMCRQARAAGHFVHYVRADASISISK